MKKWILLLAAVLAVSFFDLWPFSREDAGGLFLVETLAVSVEEDTVFLTAGDRTGSGKTVDEALETLGEKTPGQLFLRQIRRVIYCGDALRRCPPEDLPQELPMSALVYHAEKMPEFGALEPVLEAREARGQRDLPTLARTLNNRLMGRPVRLPEVEAEYADP